MLSKNPNKIIGRSLTSNAKSAKTPPNFGMFDPQQLEDLIHSCYGHQFTVSKEFEHASAKSVPNFNDRISKIEENGEILRFKARATEGNADEEEINDVIPNSNNPEEQNKKSQPIESGPNNDEDGAEDNADDNALNVTSDTNKNQNSQGEFELECEAAALDKDNDEERGFQLNLPLDNPDEFTESNHEEEKLHEETLELPLESLLD